MLVGDFNVIAGPHEQRGGITVDLFKCKNFINWMSSCKLMDLGSIGSRFTWRGPQWQGYDRIFKRLDRALCNVEWRLRFSDAFVSTLPGV